METHPLPAMAYSNILKIYSNAGILLKGVFRYHSSIHTQYSFYITIDIGEISLTLCPSSQCLLLFVYPGNPSYSS